MKREQQVTKPQSGFTLVELLVVIGLLAITASISSGIFAAIMRSYNKANILNKVRENGDYALSLMKQQIRNAEDIESPSCGGNGSSITFVDQDLRTTTFGLSSANGNGAIFKDNAASCTTGNTSSCLTDTDARGGVNVTSLSFSVSCPEGAPKTVTINLALQQAVLASTRIDYQAQIPLSTTVSLRSY